MTDTVLVSPVAARTENRPLAARRRRATARTALVDGTLNKVSDWGQGMLDAAEQVLAATLPEATFQRIDLNPLENPPPDRWVAATLADVDYVVFSAGDCVTCTSRSVRDAIWSELAGLPAAVVCTGSMAEIVEQVCATYGMRDLARFAVTESFFGRDRAQICTIARPFVDQLGRRLVG